MTPRFIRKTARAMLYVRLASVAIDHAVDPMSPQEMCREPMSERTFELPCTFPTVRPAITKPPDRLEQRRQRADGDDGSATRHALANLLCELSAVLARDNFHMIDRLTKDR